MEEVKFTLKSDKVIEYNDEVYDSRTFELQNYIYNFSILPKTKYWRFGIRLSETKDIKFFHPSRRYKDPIPQNTLEDIHLGVGDHEDKTWRNPNRLHLTQYYFDGKGEELKAYETYAENSTVDWSIRFDNVRSVLVVMFKSGNFSYNTELAVKEKHKYFKVFAWADHIAYEIDCTVDINPVGNSKMSDDPLELAITSSRFDQIINRLVDGNEEQRAELLRVIQTSTLIDRSALSMRLRSEIETRFNPGNEKAFASAIRDPKKISSIRSWLLSSLIWTDAENPLNRELILKHITNYEPDENVRYWTLAGLFQKKVSYLDRAAEMALTSDISAIKSDVSVVSLLAKAIKSPLDPNLLETFKTILLSNKFEEAWKILRILRVVPIPTLAPEVCSVLDKKFDNGALAYDAFYALANAEMINAAVNILTNNPGIRGLIERIFSTIRGSNINTVRNFVHMLLPFERKEVDSILSEAHRSPETRDIAGLIMDYLDDYRQNGVVKGLYVAGFDADTIDVNKDWLNIQEDVQTLTAVMLAKEVKPPLAIGLFGDWGTGKTFFIRSMQAEVEKISKKSKDSDARFCSNTVQIDFNAWHYVDANLWASLISSIFEKLAAYVCPQITAEEQQATFLSELGSTKTVVSEAQAEKVLAENQITEKQKKLQALQLEREQKKVTLKDLQVEDISKLLTPEENKQLNDSLNAIGIPAVLNSVSDINNVVSEVYTVKGRITALFLSIVNSKSRWLIIALLIFLLIGIPLGVWIIHKYLDVNKIITTITLVISEAVALISTVVFVVRKALQKVGSAISVVEDSKQRIDTLLAEKRRTPSAAEAALQKEILELNLKEREAVAKLTAATNRLIEIEERIRSLKEEQSLNRFLTDRMSSEDYRKHLGLISTIRQDLESLTKRLGKKQETDSKFKPVDRIILYIDDLDRCPSEKVMEVLQAVHLLLAFPLFVVVVGVDPRWLLHSLASEHSAFNNSGVSLSNDPNSWRTTPQNFLEKIFQIPFGLRPMNSKGFGNLMQGLLTPSNSDNNIFTQDRTGKDIVPQDENLDVKNQTPNTPPSSETALINAEGSATQSRQQSTDLTEKGTVPSKTSATEQFKINEESLVIKSWETKFAEELFRMIPTPRSVKRFANIYRILKASVPRERLVNFEGSAELPGDFQVPMLLLGVLTGAPAEAAKLFPALLKKTAQGKAIKESFKNIEIKKEEKTSAFDTLIENMLPIIDANWFPNDTELLTEWIPRVSRFSFDLGRTIQE